MSFYGADYNLDLIKKNSSLFLRERNGVSVDECARLCLTEPAFNCESFSFQSFKKECKWSSLVPSVSVDFDDEDSSILLKDLYSFYESKIKTIFNF